MTAAQTVASLPALLTGRPKVVRGFGTFEKLVFGRDGDAKFFLRFDGEGPEAAVAEDVAFVRQRDENRKRAAEVLRSGKL